MSKELIPVKRESFGLAVHMARRFHAVVPTGTTKEDIENPMFWSHVRSQMTTNDRIEIISEDGGFVAEGIVRQVEGFGAYVAVIYAVNLAAVQPTARSEAQDRFVVENRGHLGWCVVDKQTGKNIREKLARKSDAERELEQHLAALAA